MKISVVALSVRGAMGQYLHCLLDELGASADVALFAPDHYEYASHNYDVVYCHTGHTRFSAGLALLNPAAARRFSNQVLSPRPDIVHIFNAEGYPWSLGLAKSCRRAGAPLALTVHDPSPHVGDLLGIANHHLRKAVLAAADGIHVHSCAALAELKPWVNPLVAANVIPHGNIAPIFLPYRKPAQMKKNTVLFFGRLEKYKGLAVLADALSLLPPHFKVTIAGPGRLDKATSRKLAKQKARVELRNRFLAPPEVADLFHHAAVCVLPYLNASQSSIPLLAAAFGVPVVATRVGGLVEDVRRVGGILVNPSDPTQLAIGIERAALGIPTLPTELEFHALVPEFLRFYQATITSRRRNRP